MATSTSSAKTSFDATREPPTIMIVQGSFQTPLVYEKLLNGLSSLGYPVIHPKLPSCTPDIPNFPESTLVDDALAIRLELTRQIEYEGKTVMVVMHSYGGLAGSEAIPESLSYANRHARDLPGGVTHLFYFAAFLFAEGQSVVSTFGGTSPNYVVEPDGRFYVLNGAKLLYNDLPESEASLWESRLIAQSYQAQCTKLTRAAWRFIPSTYLICENDQAMPPQFQETFAARASSRVERCSAGHSPMLSQPQVLVDKIIDALKSAVIDEDGGHR